MSKSPICKLQTRFLMILSCMLLIQDGSYPARFIYLEYEVLSFAYIYVNNRKP